MTKKEKKQFILWELRTVYFILMQLAENERQESENSGHYPTDSANQEKGTGNTPTPQPCLETTFVCQGSSGYLKTMWQLLKQAISRKEGASFFLVGYRKKELL